MSHHQSLGAAAVVVVADVGHSNLKVVDHGYSNLEVIMSGNNVDYKLKISAHLQYCWKTRQDQQSKRFSNVACHALFVVAREHRVIGLPPANGPQQTVSQALPIPR